MNAVAIAVIAKDSSCLRLSHLAYDCPPILVTGPSSLRRVSRAYGVLAVIALDAPLLRRTYHHLEFDVEALPHFMNTHAFCAP